MQATSVLTRKGFTDLAAFVFESGAPVVIQTYSGYSQPLHRFRSPSELISDIESAFATNRNSIHYAIYYSDTKGHFLERRITLNPKKCDGHTWRYTIEGWGLIQFQSDLRRAPAIECH